MRAVSSSLAFTHTYLSLPLPFPLPPFRDAAALAHFWQWLESSLAAGQAVSEADVGRKLEECRAAQPGFVDTSFGTIAGQPAYQSAGQ